MAEKFKSAVGLFIGTDTVDLVELKDVRGSIRLTNAVRTEIKRAKPGTSPPGLVEEEADAILEALKEAQEESEIAAPEVATALSGKDTIVRLFKMTYLPKKQREQAVKFEAKRYIPFRVEEVISNAFVVEEKRREGQMLALFVACKKDLVGRYLMLLDRAGFKPTVLDAAPMALVSLFSFNGQLDKKQSTAILHVNDNETANIYIVQNEVPHLTRDVSLGEVKAEIRQKVASEIGLSLDYYKRQFPTATVTKLILCGEGDFTGWDEFLTSELGLAVEVADPAKNISTEKKVSPGACTAIGLALRSLRRPKLEVNLLPPALIPKKEKVVGLAVFEIIAAVLILIGVHLFLSNDLRLVSKEIDKVEAVEPHVPGIAWRLPVDQLEPIEDNLIERATLLNSVIGERVFLTKKMSELVNLRPAHTWFTRLSYSEKLSRRWEVEKVRRRKISRKMEIRGIVSLLNRQQELNTANRFVYGLQANKDFLEGFATARLKSTKVGSFAGVEVTNFSVILSSE